VGTPERVARELRAMAGELGIGELVVNTIAWEHAARIRSYELLAAEFGLETSDSKDSIFLLASAMR